MVIWFHGGMSQSVTAYCDIARHHRIELEDDATIFTRYANGATGVFITSTGESPGTNRLEITGDLGKLVLENGKLKWWRLREPERVFCFQSSEYLAQIPCDYEEYLPADSETAYAGILQSGAAPSCAGSCCWLSASLLPAQGKPRLPPKDGHSIAGAGK